jgi:putative DNA primase/helicase
VSGLAEVGIRLKSEAPGTHRTRCPGCNRTGHDDALAVTIRPDSSAVWLCHRCREFKGVLAPPGGGERPRSSVRRTAILRRSDAEAPGNGLSAGARSRWNAGRPFTTGCAAAAYLRGRGCELPRNDVRQLPALAHPCGYTGPVILALVTDTVTGAAISLHTTWLSPDGSGKAPIERPRLLAKGCRKAGGVVRLWPDAAVTTGLLIAEGVETALTAAHGFTPVWACIDAGNLANFPMLAGVEALTIVADHDRAGVRAAEECAARWLEAGREVRVWASEVEGQDFNDFAAGAAA